MGAADFLVTIGDSINGIVGNLADAVAGLNTEWSPLIVLAFAGAAAFGINNGFKRNDFAKIATMTAVIALWMYSVMA